MMLNANGTTKDENADSFVTTSASSVQALSGAKGLEEVGRLTSPTPDFFARGCFEN